jgi:transcriptional regulator PpsR
MGGPGWLELCRLEELPDGLIVTGSDLRILAANRAFVEMAHLVSPAQIVGQRLSDFLGRSATELNVLTSNLRNHGAVRNFTTVLRDRFGNEEEVEVSAVTTSSESSATYGLSVRNVARTFRVDRQAEEGLPSSPDQLTRLVGRVPLREIVRQTTDFIEKLCIEAALEVTGDNRASAAEMLGLSRQGLYSKLKRFELDH